jgi:hypothetical protein
MWFYIFMYLYSLLVVYGATFMIFYPLTWAGRLLCTIPVGVLSFVIMIVFEFDLEAFITGYWFPLFIVCSTMLMLSAVVHVILDFIKRRK